MQSSIDMRKCAFLSILILLLTAGCESGNKSSLTEAELDRIAAEWKSDLPDMLVVAGETITCDEIIATTTERDGVVVSLKESFKPIARARGFEDFHCIREQIMAKVKPSREEALSLLKEYNKSEGLIKHALAVEAAMRYAARKRGENEEKWGVIALVHDLDYEQFPDQHCRKTEEILRSHNWPEEYIRAVLSHGWGICTDVEPQSELEKTLYAVDELTGLIVATALVRPSKSVMDMKVKSVRKKWKDKSFAAGVNRDIIEKGADILGVELSELIDDAIMGMREVAEEIGLKGEL